MNTGDGTVGGSGGSGSGGRIKIFVPDCANATISATYAVDGGTTGVAAANGTYMEVCGYSLSLDDLGVSEYWVMYPNPVNDQLTISLEAEDLNGYKVQVINNLGGVVMETAIHSSQTTLDTSNIAQGVYFVTVHQNGTQTTKKLIKK
jgi:hypothetical protein